MKKQKKRNNKKKTNQTPKENLLEFDFSLTEKEILDLDIQLEFFKNNSRARAEYGQEWLKSLNKDQREYADMRIYLSVVCGIG